MAIRFLAIIFCLLATGCGRSRYSDNPDLYDIALLHQYGGIYQSSQELYINRLGNRVSEAAGLAGRCRFFILNTDIINAFVTDRCRVYVTRGMMALASSESELAFILFHELGHVTHKHSAQKRDFGGAIDSLQSLRAWFGNDRLFELLETRMIRGYFAFSRANELEADHWAAVTARRAGFDAAAGDTIMTKMQMHYQFMAESAGFGIDQAKPDWARTHPVSQVRTARLRALTARMGAKRDAAGIESQSYLHEIDDIHYGGDPSTFLSHGRRVAMPKHRLTFTLPPGVEFTGGSDTGSFAATNGWVGRLEIVEARRKSLIDQAMALARSEGGSGPVKIRSLRGRAGEGVGMIHLSAEQDSGVIEIASFRGEGTRIYSFIAHLDRRRMPTRSVEELFDSIGFYGKGEQPPLHSRVIRIRPVQQRDTLARVAALMDDPAGEQLFKTLNAISSDEELRQRRHVKIVARARPGW